MRRINNLIGQKFGKLLVLEDSGTRKHSNNSVIWNCLCDCGNIAKILSYNLSGGIVKSCGCSRNERTVKISNCVICNKLRSPKERWHFTDPTTHNKTSLCVNCYSRLWKQANPDKHREATYKWNAKNRDIVLANKKRFRIAHKEQINTHMREHCRTNIIYRLSCRIRSRLHEALKGISKSKRTEELLGCSFVEAKQYIENQFYAGMTWKNYGSYWEIDHIEELHTFDLTDQAQLKKAAHYTNLQPLTIPDHIKKSAESRRKLRRDAKWIF